MDCKHCNAQLFPDCECLTSSINRSDSDLQFVLPKAPSNSGAKMIKHSAIEIWSRIPSETKHKTCLALSGRSIRNIGVRVRGVPIFGDAKIFAQI